MPRISVIQAFVCESFVSVQKRLRTDPAQRGCEAHYPGADKGGASTNPDRRELK
jgi:hypothetical protein